MTPAKCPQCGADLEAGAEICKACGHQLTESEMQAEAAPSPPPRPASPSAAPAGAKGTSIDVAEMLGDLRSRWGLEQTPLFTAALILAGLALVIGTIAVIMFLIAASDDGGQKNDAYSLFSIALPAALGAAGLLAYLRLETGPLSGEVHSQDRMIGFGINGFCLLFILLMLYKGLDESLAAESAYYYYALLFAFFALGFSVIAKPTPAALGGMASAMIGFVGIGVAMVLAVIGAIQYRSDSYSTYAMGATFLDAAFVIVALIFAWFLGMRKASA